MSGLKTVLLALAVFCATATVIIAQEDRILVINEHESLSRVYVDGVLQFLPNANFPNETDNVTLPAEARLLAVQAISTVDSCAGFVGSVTDNYYLTNERWICSEFGGDNWWGFGFDDTDWRNAYEVGRHGYVPECPNLDYFPEISLQAYWIWTHPTDVKPDPDAVDRAVFCRGYLPFCSTSQPCQNGGTCLENDEQLCACTEDWAGRYCEKPNTPCLSDPCGNNGTCTFTEDSYECFCVPEFTGINCELPKNRTLSITAKSTIYDLFIDGVRQSLTYANNWTVADNVSLSPTNRLVAIMALDNSEQCAGIIGSVTGDFLVTDINWRCNPNAELNWQELGWEDSVWPEAHVMGTNYNVTSPERCEDVLAGISTISEDANWIWTPSILNDDGEYHQTIYCRAYIPICDRESPCVNGGSCNRNNASICSCLVGYIGEFCQSVDLKRLILTAKDHLYAVYVDGNPIPIDNGTDYLKTDTVMINSISRLVAVMAIQLVDDCPGILVSVDDSRGDYVVSNVTWKCSPTAPVGWAELGFDDSTWLPAEVHRKNEFSNDTKCADLEVISDISPEAYWIWTDTTLEQHVTVYCRGVLPLCDVHPCKNGGVCNDNARALCTCPAGYEGVYCENIETTDITAVYNAPTPAPTKRESNKAGKSNLSKLIKP